MSSPANEQHILLINDAQGQRSVILDAATYSIGRDQKNAIVLPFNAISREHALLLRVPNQRQGGYHYRIIDGNAAGHPSKNGIIVNGHPCRTHDLEQGNRIEFGGVIDAAYLCVHMSTDALQEFLQTDVVDFQSIKQPLTNPHPTVIKV